MNPCKISIIGDFWDCQIYRNRLYLWYTDGKLTVVDWIQLVEFFIEDEYDRLAFTCAFLQGGLLYGDSLQVLFNDKEFKALLFTKFNRINSRELIIDEFILRAFALGEQDNPFRELQTDSEILNNKIYAATYKGILSATAHRKVTNSFKVSSKAPLVNDFVAFNIKAGRYAKIALSGGNEGLYEYRASSYYSSRFDWEDEEPGNMDDIDLRKISGRHSSFADYNFSSIYNSSLLGESFLSYHKWADQEDYIPGKKKLVFEEEISQQAIFGRSEANSLSWGTNEKLYYAADNVLEVVTFDSRDNASEMFSQKKLFDFQPWKGRIIKGGTSYFGTIVECENALVILTGNDNFFNIPGEITRWRVYPRSINYENHLHVIQNDRLEIYAFNDDYFKDQQEKDFGIMFQEKYFKFGRK